MDEMVYISSISRSDRKQFPQMFASSDEAANLLFNEKMKR